MVKVPSPQVSIAFSCESERPPRCLSEKPSQALIPQLMPPGLAFLDLVPFLDELEGIRTLRWVRLVWWLILSLRVDEPNEHCSIKPLEC